MFARFKLAQTTVVLQWLVLLVIVSEFAVVTAEEDKPIAEKLTRAIDKRIPPQIAYFIPDQALNDTLLNYISPYGFNGFSSYHPPTISFSEVKSPKNHKHTENDSDLEVSQQHPQQYVSDPVAKNHKYSYKRKVPPNASQNFSYQINFSRGDKLRDQESNVPQIDRLQSVSSPSSEISSVLKKVKSKSKSKRKQKPKIHIKRPTSLDYANTLPDLRDRIMFLKKQHKAEYEESNERHHKQDTDTEAEVQQQLQQHLPQPVSNEDSDSTYDEYYDTDDTPVVVKKDHRTKSTKATKTNNNGNGSNSGKKLKSSNKPRYSSSTKLSHAATTMALENESNDNGKLSATRKYPKNHHQHDKYCEHATSATVNNQLDVPDTTAAFENEQPDTVPDLPEESDVNADFENISEPQKGFEIYLTKVIKHPKTHKVRRRMKTHHKKKPPRQTAFVPTRILSSVRRISEIQHRPRMYRQPTLREKLLESGGHVVYSEDGYEDSYYNHGKENKDLEYSKSVRAKRSTSATTAAADIKNLKGQELIDHLDILIRNISDYLNSSDIIPDTKRKYPLYNSENPNIHESSIKYSEYAKPVVDAEISSELYESKTKECEEADEGVSDDVDLSNAHNATMGGSKKRLGKLGDRLECLKSKLFGENPLDNPLFDEKRIQQPEPSNLFTSALKESEKIETIASVYSDVMDNIKFNSVNQHQRIFSDYGISDNFPLESVNRPSVAVKSKKASNELNTNEKYADYKEKVDSDGKPKVPEKPLVFANPFKDPVQLPILDISRYIPTPKYPPTAGDYPLQTDFQPIIPPYLDTYSSSKEVTSPAASTTIVSTTTTVKSTTPLYGPVRTLPTPPSRYRKGPYRQVIAAAASNQQNSIQHTHTSNLLRMPHQNIVLLKDRRPIALVRVISNPIQQQALPRP